MTTSPPAIELTPHQVEELKKQLATMRHDINNHLSLIMAASELMRRKPETVERMTQTLTEQPAKITLAMKKFSADLEAALSLKCG